MYLNGEEPAETNGDGLNKGVSLDWLRRNIPCQKACPVRTHAGGYCHLIALGMYEEAYALAAAQNPLASICGHICAAPCEEACRRTALDKPVAIRALKRFVAEHYGVYSKVGRLVTVGQMRGRRGPEAGERGSKVAIVGAGPAGLSAAHDLALVGYRPEVFEASNVPGGMLYLGIPEYRLPRYIIHAQADYIHSLGVEFHYGQRLGEDFSIKDLRARGFKAIFLAIGAHKSRGLSIEGVLLDGVFNGVDFLLNANLNYRVEVGRNVVVIGGGNVAIDVARSVLRFEPVAEEGYAPQRTMRTAMDVARSAMRFGAKEVSLVCLEKRAEMPAFASEVAEAEAEGITIRDSLGPKRILGSGGAVRGLEAVRVRSVFDAEGRFNPTFYPNSEHVIDCDTVVLAIGQQTDLSVLGTDSGVSVTARGTIGVDPETLETSEPGVFAGGDAAFGPRSVIAAVADGRRAAESIHRQLSGIAPPQPRHKVFVFPRKGFRPLENYDRYPRQEIPGLPLERRIGIAEVELGYEEEQARLEASRCLRCWVNTVFEGSEESGSECILCGGCADVCPESCIALVSAERVAASPELGADLASDFGVPGCAMGEGIEALMIKDETKCIRCGLCEERCPVGCITMESFLEAEGALTQ
jgi:NADPH-dependent glutamate synthase beta subunit-like oxidoreductase/NAD-dependent dihydropyrimidine dehydrogenase PreA subunit